MRYVILALAILAALLLPAKVIGQTQQGAILTACPLGNIWHVSFDQVSQEVDTVDTAVELQATSPSFWVVTGVFMYLVIPKRGNPQYLLQHGPWSAPQEDQLSSRQHLLICPAGPIQILRLRTPPTGYK